MQVNPSSLWKVMDLVGRLSEKPLKVTFQGEVRVYKPLPLVISDDFPFKTIKCQRCGKCCAGIRHDLFWLKHPDPFGIKLGFLKLKVNGKNKTIYFHRNGNKPCAFLKDKLCKIHLIKPLHCLMPPIHVDEWEGKYYLKKRFYKDFPCKAKVLLWSDPKGDSEKFKRLSEEAQGIGVTFESNYIYYLGGNKE